MVSRVYLPLNLKISSKSADAQKSLVIIDAFIKTLPIIMKELANRSYRTASFIAPVGDKKFKRWSKKTQRPANKPFYSTGTTEGLTGGLRKSIKLTKSDDGFTLGTSGGGDDEIKAVMQEFGYPYRNFWGPYPPNPKRKPKYSGSSAGRVRGIGYLRAGMIIAANSLYSDNDALSGEGLISIPSRNDIRNYQAVIERQLVNVVSKFLTAFAKADKASVASLPTYYKSKIEFPTATVSSNVSSFGSVKGLQINVPLNIQFRGQSFNYAGLDPSRFLKG